jgi:hypothetical protein
MPILLSNLHVARPTDHGHGGAPFTCYPSYPGFALVGLAVRAGSWIDQVTPIFAELLDHGGLGAEIYGPCYGGYGGSPRELRAAPGHVVTGLQTRSGSYLDGLRLLQTPWDGALAESGSSWTDWLLGSAGGGHERPDLIAEPSGRAVAIGINGRAGWYVDALGIVTADYSRVAPTNAHAPSSRGSKSAHVLG